MVINRHTLRWFSLGTGAVILLLLAICVWAALQHRESTLAIRPSGQGASMPDGFFIWHHLDANGIRFKSITPKDDTLLIKFDSRAQSSAAKEVLDRSLPQGYIVAQLDDDTPASLWISRLRDNAHRLG
ncbi:EnvZ/OmpR regulon moderator MzrA [Trabulsiella odontotermitis]|uniref:EnvZ/OmpR regulon moderator MzrA n=1 Tax=Trabulsiella odontotermitis TaxID=379893 RepID=UPI0006BA1F0D|nr:EnvZ/OmpR regulon moderator MzrA [Trabulsiella odontotermitis]